ncbi:MAG: hypothetical protein IT186_10525 [Acidobacteria bacterium]|nr:hypothetical protein [Acidobacteriota bacterium]
MTLPWTKPPAGAVFPGSFVLLLLTLAPCLSGFGAGPAAPSPMALNPSAPSSPVKLVFLHHSTGENWLADGNGDLGLSLRDNNYFVSDTYYGWGPRDEELGGPIGDSTDIGHWYNWFLGPSRNTHISAVLANSERSTEYTRMGRDPGGENQIVMFKSCFPNSNLKGSSSAPVPALSQNPLRGQDSYSDAHTFANAKGIYVALLDFFATRTDKLFIVVTAPPLRQEETEPQYAANARAFNTWLARDWLAHYPNRNVFVFDFYNVLTSNGGSTRTNDPNTNDTGRADGNHHRLRDGGIQHSQTVNHSTSAYWTGDSHPSGAGNQKATAEFLPLLNIAYHCWKGTGGCSGTTAAYTTIIPAVSHSPGMGTSQLRSDVAGVNLSSTAAAVQVTYLPSSGEAVTEPSTVPANGIREWPDILCSLFRMSSSAETSGVLKFTSDRPLLLTSRTFNEDPSGTFGAFLPQVASDGGITHGQKGYLPHLKKSSRFRTNLGITNLGSTDVEVGVRLYGKDGESLGVELVLPVPAGSFRQVTDVFGQCETGMNEIAYAELDVRTSGGRIWAFASMIDNVTNDPTIIPLLVP